MMDGNWQAAVFAAIKQIGIGQVGYVPDASHALPIQEMHAFDERAAALLNAPTPSIIVRPMRRTASSRAKRGDTRLTERLANSAGSPQRPPAGTEPMRGNRGTSWIPSGTGSAAGAWLTKESVGR